MTEWGGVPGFKYRLAFRVVAMGDTNACDIIQSSHIDILDQYDAICAEGLIKYKQALPDSGIIQDIYIDVLIVSLIATDRQLVHGPHTDRDLIHAAHNAYRESGLQRAPDKSSGWGAETSGTASFLAWGTHVCNRPGTVGTPAPKRLLLAWVLFLVLSMKAVPKILLVSILGLLVHPFMHRRELCACLHHVYKVIAPYKDLDLIVIKHDILQELYFAALLLPVVYSNIRAQIDTVVSATDATPSRGGATEACVPQTLAETLFASSYQRGGHRRLDGKEPLSTQILDDATADPQLVDVVRCLYWRVTRSYVFREIHHINFQEFLESSAELERRVGRTLAPCRYASLDDSHVTMGCWAHGRSSSYLLNGLARKNVGWHVLGRKEQNHVYVPSAENVADDPPRDVGFRAPHEPPT